MCTEMLEKHVESAISATLLHVTTNLKLGIPLLVLPQKQEPKILQLCHIIFVVKIKIQIKWSNSSHVQSILYL
jgi:molybdenum cofactor biosynthesis enzyme